jgi:hypothetical protein
VFKERQLFPRFPLAEFLYIIQKIITKVMPNATVVSILYFFYSIYVPLTICINFFFQKPGIFFIGIDLNHKINYDSPWISYLYALLGVSFSKRCQEGFMSTTITDSSDSVKTSLASLPTPLEFCSQTSLSSLPTLSSPPSLSLPTFQHVINIFFGSTHGAVEAFSSVLTSEKIEAIFRQHGSYFGGISWNTSNILGGSLAQVLAADSRSSCAFAVSLIANYCISLGVTPPSSCNTGNDCHARNRISVPALQELTQTVASEAN